MQGRSRGGSSAASCIPQALPSVEGTSAYLLFQLVHGAEGIPSAVRWVLNLPYLDQTLKKTSDTCREIAKFYCLLLTSY